jgi:prepilin-type N-terminal cleavage/methylation domain-containing protein
MNHLPWSGGGKGTPCPGTAVPPGLRRPGFTLVEVLVVLAIVATLVAIMTPVLAGAKRSAKVASSIQKLKQLHASLEIYRQDNSGTSSDYYGQGLAPLQYFWDTRFGFLSDGIQSPCGFDQTLFNTGPNTMPAWVSYTAPFFDPIHHNPGMGHYLETYQDNAVVFVDCYCNPAGTSMRAPLQTKRGLAVTLGGTLVNRRKTGDGFLLQFYSDPPSD